MFCYQAAVPQYLCEDTTFYSHNPLKNFWVLQAIFVLPEWCCLFINWQCENQTIALSNESYLPITNTSDVLESIIKLPGSLDMWKVSIYMGSDTSSALAVVEQEKKKKKKEKKKKLTVRRVSHHIKMREVHWVIGAWLYVIGFGQTFWK